MLRYPGESLTAMALKIWANSISFKLESDLKTNKDLVFYIPGLTLALNDLDVCYDGGNRKLWEIHNHVLLSNSLEL